LIPTSIYTYFTYNTKYQTRNNSSADGLEASLGELGIKSKRRGGISFFDSKEIKAFLDIISLCNFGNDMMSFTHLFEYVKGVGYAIAKDIFEALMRLGDGNINRGLVKPNGETNVFEKKIKNIQLGLFDEFVELGSISRFKHLNLDDNSTNMIENTNFKRVWFDLAVPKDIEDSTKKEIVIYRIDDLQDTVKKNIENREIEIKSSYKIVGEFTKNFFNWLNNNIRKLLNNKGTAK
jgi:hypothetical protein